MAHSLWSGAGLDSQNRCENKGGYLGCSWKIKGEEVAGKEAYIQGYVEMTELLPAGLGKGKEKQGNEAKIKKERSYEVLSEGSAKCHDTGLLINNVWIGI